MPKIGVTYHGPVTISDHVPILIGAVDILTCFAAWFSSNHSGPVYLLIHDHFYYGYLTIRRRPDELWIGEFNMTGLLKNYVGKGAITVMLANKEGYRKTQEQANPSGSIPVTSIPGRAPDREIVIVIPTQRETLWLGEEGA